MRPIGKNAGLFAACVALAGCPTPSLDAGDGSPSGSAGGAAVSAAGTGSIASCSPLDGVYRFTYTERSGTCGPQPSELLQFNQGRSMPSFALSCQSAGEAMSTPCQLEYDRTCAVSDPVSGVLVGNSHVTGVLSEPSDNTQARGTLDISQSSTSGQSCESTYDVIATLTQ
jgi:hypothetical protein